MIELSSVDHMWVCLLIHSFLIISLIFSTNKERSETRNKIFYTLVCIGTLQVAHPFLSKPGFGLIRISAGHDIYMHDT